MQETCTSLVEWSKALSCVSLRGQEGKDLDGEGRGDSKPEFGLSHLLEPAQIQVECFPK